MTESQAWVINPRRKGRGRRKSLLVSAALSLAVFTMVASAQWLVNVQSAPSAKGYGRSSGLATAFIDTVDVSASLVGDMSDVQPQGDLSVQFSSTSPFVIHLSSMTVADGPYGPAVCAVTTADFQTVFPLNVDVPANGQSTTVVLDNALFMQSTAPSSCADTVFPVPITGITGNRI